MLKELLVFIICSFLSLSALYAAELPNLGDSAAQFLSAKQEQQIGKQAYLYLYGSGKLINDPLVHEYVNALAQKLVNASDSAPESLQVFIVNDLSINAFAIPGGYIGVNLGLLLNLESESELAAVIAHEIAHLSQHHIARLIERSHENRWQNIAAILAAMVLATQSGEAGMGAATAAMAHSAQQRIDFTREFEMEADRIGIKTLAKAGFEPRHMAEAFNHIEQLNHFIGSDVPEFLRTHPLSATRIAEARNRAAQYPYQQRANSFEFYLVRERLRKAQFSNATDLLEHYKQSLKQKKYQNLAATRYGYALALLGEKQFKAAQAELNLIEAALSNHRFVLLASVQSDYIAKNYLAVEQRLLKLLNWYPNNRSLVLFASDLFIKMDKASTALNYLKHFSYNHPLDLDVLALKIKAYEQLEDLIASHEALADYFAAVDEPSRAVKQLEFALQQLPAGQAQRKQQLLARKTSLEQKIHKK